jgi:hypothetical protein
VSKGACARGGIRRQRHFASRAQGDLLAFCLIAFRLLTFRLMTFRLMAFEQANI